MLRLVKTDTCDLKQCKNMYVQNSLYFLLRLFIHTVISKVQHNLAQITQMFFAKLQEYIYSRLQ